MSYNDFEEQVFNLMYFHHWTWDTVVEMPTDRRLRYINHIERIINDKNKKDEEVLNALQQSKQAGKFPSQPPF